LKSTSSGSLSGADEVSAGRDRPALISPLDRFEDLVETAIVHAVDDFYVHARQHSLIGPFLQRLGDDGLERLIRAQREHAWMILSVLCRMPSAMPVHAKQGVGTHSLVWCRNT